MLGPYTRPDNSRTPFFWLFPCGQPPRSGIFFRCMYSGFYVYAPLAHRTATPRAHRSFKSSPSPQPAIELCSRLWGFRSLLTSRLALPHAELRDGGNAALSSQRRRPSRGRQIQVGIYAVYTLAPIVNVAYAHRTPIGRLLSQSCDLGKGRRFLLQTRRSPTTHRRPKKTTAQRYSAPLARSDHHPSLSFLPGATAVLLISTVFYLIHFVCCHFSRSLQPDFP